jgi:hypothetical protein
MEKVKVKVKNKPNHLKAVAFLGKYSQHKGSVWNGEAVRVTFGS